MNRPGVWGWFAGWWPGRGRGGGRGFRNWFYRTGLTGWQRVAMGWPAWGGVPPVGTPSPQDEVDVLRQQAQALSQTLQEIQQRIEELEKQRQSNEA